MVGGFHNNLQDARVRVDGAGSGEASERRRGEDIPKPRLGPKSGARTLRLRSGQALGHLIRGGAGKKGIVFLYYCRSAPLAIELRPPVNWPAGWGRSAGVIGKLCFNLAPTFAARLNPGTNRRASDAAIRSPI